MAEFFENLWHSIFTPGPTPTLVVATNATFAALQVLLVGLLVATRSVHFAVLSFLCGGLWWAINWFATEIRTAQEKEERAKKAKEVGKGREGSGDESGTETEEAAIRPPPRSSGARLHVQKDEDALKKRRSLGDVSGTDSEWDKVSETEVLEE